MSLLLIFSLIAQLGANSGGHSSSGPVINIDVPVLSVTGYGTKTTAVKASEYKIILYADAHSEDQEEARKKADDLRKEVIKKTKKLGGSEDDVVLTNLNLLEPIEEDPYYRVEQDIQIWLKDVSDINKVKEGYLLIEGVQIGSVTPIIAEMNDYTPAIEKARKDAISSAKKEAHALASELGVILGEPVYITENIIYPSYSGYESAEESNITVSVTLCYEIIYKK